MRFFLAGPFHAVALVLIVAGISKLTRLGSTTSALRALSIPAPRSAEIGLLGFEIAVGSGMLIISGRVFATAAAFLYGTFIVVVQFLRTRSPQVSCGCFGVASGKPGSIQLWLNCMGFATTLLFVWFGAPNFADAAVQAQESARLGGIQYGALVVSAVALMMLLDTVLAPSSSDSARRLRFASDATIATGRRS
ncbi:MauE/DoxX family redox-associated membrane protein [Candidatus Microthrix parvicella]|uniref:MauE/DoxX family redox-associated membrane protein n=1 Tax=Candidatus Neomicrothrix parvicella TaxID=41950 RepID=UPI000366888D|nr:MauE/DoxX family redox-associated membrane protein [Candidatus Microthrix parvicella]